MACLKHAPIFDRTKNEYYTQKKYWENITHLIPKNKIIFEAFLLNSKSNSINYWKEMGYNIVGNNKLDFLTDELPEYDIIVSNPPYETNIKQKIFKKLVELDKPFLIVANIMNVFSKYYRTIFGDKLKHLQIIKPLGKIKFEEYNEEQDKLVNCSEPAFYNCYLAYRMNLSNEELWLK